MLKRHIKLVMSKSMHQMVLILKLIKVNFVVIVGPSGAGKTTILNLLGEWIKQQVGKFLVDGQDVAKIVKDS